MLAVKINCALGLNFFYSAIYTQKCAWLNFGDSTYSEIDKCAMVLVPPLENEVMEAFCQHHCEKGAEHSPRLCK
jgi:hypothetical protein